ncbi:serine hydrolase, partial [Pseudomonas lactis]|uniref:serine hydrolase n=1 Tax=Pseudomonas lactis TaxID=1615674 RepID=UPI001F18FB37
MVRGLLCVALLFVTVNARAEIWPDKEWALGTALAGPAVDALDAYAFPTRDDATRTGIRTDALLVIRDGEIIYERYAAPTTVSTPHLTWSVSKSLMATVLGVASWQCRFKLSDAAARFYPPMML